MNAKILFFSLIIFGEMGAKRVEPQLIKIIRAGDLTQRFLDRHNLTAQRLNEPVNGFSPLTVAIVNKMDEAVRLLVAAGVDVNKQMDGNVPLELAVKDGTVPVVRCLLENGASLTPKACRLASKRYDMFNFFSDTVGKIRFGDRNDGNNLFNLSRSDVDVCLENMLLTVSSPKDLQDLLSRGARTDYRDEKNEIALDYAVNSCYEKNAKILLSQGSPSPQKDNIKQLRERCEKTFSGMPNRCCKTVDVIVNAKPNDSIYAQFLDDVKNGKLTVGFLKKHFSGINRLDINRTFVEVQNEDALTLAVRHCYCDVAKLLLKYDARVSRYTFGIALQKCSKKMLRLLMDHGALLKHAVKPFEIIIQYNPYAESIIKWLAPIISYHDRQIAVLFACLKGHTKIAEILLNNGASIRGIGDHSQTPLWNAILSQQLDMVKFIIDNGGRTKLTGEQLRYVKKFFPAAYDLVGVSD